MPFDLIQGLLLYLILVASVCVHEWAHAAMANQLGDPTPRSDGRTTLNPGAHFDPIGTLIMPMVFIFLFRTIAPFGWGKRIRLQPEYFRKPVRDETFVWMAGPAANFGICLAAGILGGIALRLGIDLTRLISPILWINATLIVINLLPIPPLDGGYVLRLVIRMREETFAMLSQWAFLILIGLFFFVEPFRQIVGGLILIIVRFNLGVLAWFTGAAVGGH